MAAKGGVNFVKYFFYLGNTISPDRKAALVALAYATARDQELAPKAILIRFVLFMSPSSPVTSLLRFHVAFIQNPYIFCVIISANWA
jgi:hypothetical protein